MLYRLLVFSFLMAVVTATGRGQDFCGTVTDAAFIDRFDAILAASRVRTAHTAGPDTITIPVTFHVEIEDGLPVVDDVRIERALEASSRWYARAGVRFVRCGRTLHIHEGEFPYQHRATVNVEIRRQATGCGSTAGNYVFINIACERSLENILSHELGHVLGLAHTHGLLNLGTTDELVDGSNCGSAGDRLCDTPADPNIVGLVDATCRYTGTAVDANGMEYRPLTDNIMSYTNSECADSLTPEQLSRVAAVARATWYSCCDDLPLVLADTVVCMGSVATFHVAWPDDSVFWFDSETAETPVAMGSAFSTPPMTKDRTWYVEGRGACMTQRTRVNVRVRPGEQVHLGGVNMLAEILEGTGTADERLLSLAGLLVFSTESGIRAYDPSLRRIRRLLDLPDPVTCRLSSFEASGDVLYAGVSDPQSGSSLFRILPERRSIETLLQLPAGSGRDIFSLTAMGDRMLFCVSGPATRSELWRTDGTVAGTVPLAAFTHAPADGMVLSFAAAGNEAVFAAADSLHGMELWHTDGTEEGTALLADVWPGTEGSRPDGIIITDTKIFFQAVTEAGGRELWVADRATGSVTQLTDLGEGPASSEICFPVAIDGRLYFSAAADETDLEPHVSDGTLPGTRKLADINPTRGSFPAGFVSFDGWIVCTADGGTGTEPWLLDPGGVKPPRMLREIDPGGAGWMSSFFVWEKQLYFSANDGQHGVELWRSDGTEEGTEQLADIVPGPRHGLPHAFVATRDALCFRGSAESGAPAIYAYSSGSTSVCAGEAALLVAGNTTGTVEWYESESAPDPLATGRHFLTPPMFATRKYWTALREGECASPRRSVTVHVLATPPRLRDTTVTPGGTVMLDAFTESGTVEWYADTIDMNPFATGRTLLLSGVERDTVLWVAVSELGCRSARIPVRVFVRTAGVQASAESPALELYPHPACTVLHLLLPGRERVQSISIHDVLGRELRRIDDPGSGGGPLVLDVASLTEGQYLVLIRFENSTHPARFVIAR